MCGTARSVRTARSLRGPWLGLILSAVAACDDPVPAPGGPAAVPSATTAPAAEPAASAAPAASDGPSEAPSAAASPAPSTSASVAAAPAESGAPTSGSASAPATPAPSGKASARTGILRPGEADRILAKGQSTKVRLLEAGAEPREPLRYALEPKRTASLEMGLTMTLELNQGTRAVPAQKIPRIATLLDLTTADAPDAGAMGVQVVVRDVGIGKDAGLPQQVADRLLPHLQGIKGLTLGYHVTPEGRVKQAGAKMPGQKGAATDPTLQQMSQSLESMIAPFPDEPVGVGARWEVVARFDSSGTELVQWSTFELRERDAKGAHLGLEVTQAAAQAEVHPPNLPPGVSAKLVEFGSRGSGESRLEFASPAPRNATMKVDSTMTLAVAQGGADSGQKTSMKSTMLVELAQKAPGAAPPAKTPAPAKSP